MADLATWRKDIDGSSKSRKAKAVNGIFNTYLNQQRGYRALWLACTAFGRGIQYSVLDEDNGLITVQTPEGQKRSKINLIGAWKRQMMPRVVKVRPEFEVIPSGGVNLETLDTVDAGNAFLHHTTFNVNGWQKLRYTMANNTIDFGICYVYIRDEEDNTNMTPVVELDDYGKEFVDPDTLEKKVTSKPVVNIKWEVLPPHYVLHDLSVGSIDDKFDVILAFQRDLTYFPLTYGIEVEPDNITNTNANHDLSLLSRMHIGQRINNGATEFIYLRKPNNKDKKGKILITTLTKVLKESTWRYKHMLDYPLVEFLWGEPPPGEFYPQPPIEDQIPIQQDMNEANSIVQENIANMGHLKWGNPQGSGIQTLTDISGQIVNHAIGREPKQLQVLPLPDYLVGHASRLGKNLEDVQNLHSVSKGTGTPNVRSAIGLDRLEEEDQEPLGITDDMWENSYIKLGMKSLKIGAEKIDTEQLITYIGNGRPRKIANFRGSMLDPDSKVSVRMTGSFMRHKGTAQKLILELANSGLIGKDKFGNIDPVRVQNMLQFAIPEVMYDKEDRQREMAYEENETIFEGNEVIPEEWEFQLIHIEIIEELLNSREFKLKIVKDAKLRERAINHWQGHRKILITAMLGAQETSGNSNEETSNAENSQT